MWGRWGRKGASIKRADVLTDVWPEPLLWRIDPNFPPGELTGIVRDAFDWWNLENSVWLFKEWAASSLVTGEPTRAPHVIATWLGADRSRLGPTAKASRLIHSDGTRELLFGVDWATRKTPAGVRNLARHEVGHALGFEHTDNVFSVMYPDCNWCPFTLDLYEAERREVVRFYGPPTMRTL